MYIATMKIQGNMTKYKINKMCFITGMIARRTNREYLIYIQVDFSFFSSPLGRQFAPKLVKFVVECKCGVYGAVSKLKVGPGPAPSPSRPRSLPAPVEYTGPRNCKVLPARRYVSAVKAVSICWEF